MEFRAPDLGALGRFNSTLRNGRFSNFWKRCWVPESPAKSCLFCSGEGRLFSQLRGASHRPESASARAGQVRLGRWATEWAPRNETVIRLIHRLHILRCSLEQKWITNFFLNRLKFPKNKDCWRELQSHAVTRIRTEVAAATTQSTNHYTITACYLRGGAVQVDLISFETGLFYCSFLCLVGAIRT